MVAPLHTCKWLRDKELIIGSLSQTGNRLVPVRVSDNTLRKETERFGQLQQEQEAKWQQQSQEVAWLQQRQREMGKQVGRLYGSLDGVMAPLKNEWRELKNIAWYRVEKVKSYQKRRRHGQRVGEQNDLQAQEISYHCDFKTGDTFSDLFWTSACQRKADLYEELVFVCDGAAWIWKLIERHFPHTVQIVDWYHASEYWEWLISKVKDYVTLPKDIGTM
jgi:hypothetical protein